MVQNLQRIPEPEEFENPDVLSKTKKETNPAKKDTNEKSAEKTKTAKAPVAKAPSLAGSSQRGPSKLVLTNQNKGQKTGLEQAVLPTFTSQYAQYNFDKQNGLEPSKQIGRPGSKQQMSSGRVGSSNMGGSRRNLVADFNKADGLSNQPLGFQPQASAAFAQGPTEFSSKPISNLAQRQMNLD